MSQQDQIRLHLTVVEHLKAQYSAVQSPCFALYVSRHYRCLSKISQTEKDYYLEEAKFWFLIFINKRFHSKKIRSMLLDQYIFLTNC